MNDDTPQPAEPVAWLYFDPHAPVQWTWEKMGRYKVDDLLPHRVDSFPVYRAATPQQPAVEPGKGRAIFERLRQMVDNLTVALTNDSIYVGFPPRQILLAELSDLCVALDSPPVAATPQQPAAADTTICPNCKGSGEVMGRSWGAGPDDYETECACGMCNGTGEQPAAASAGASERIMRLADTYARSYKPELKFGNEYRESRRELESALIAALQPPVQTIAEASELEKFQATFRAVSLPYDSLHTYSIADVASVAKEAAWEAWKARAALQPPPVATAQQSEAPAGYSDTERIDWIAAKVAEESGIWMMPCGESLRFVQLRHFGECENYPAVEGLRNAIDAAMATESPAHPAAGEATERGGAA